MIAQFFQQYRNAFAGIGVVILSPAAFLVTFGLMNEAGFTSPNDWLDNLIRTNETAKALFDIFLHPAAVLGGIVLTMIINSLPLLHFRIQPDEATFSAIITFKNRLLNAALVTVSFSLLSSVLMYAFLENFRIVAR